MNIIFCLCESGMKVVYVLVIRFWNDSMLAKGLCVIFLYWSLDDDG